MDLKYCIYIFFFEMVNNLSNKMNWMSPTQVKFKGLKIPSFHKIGEYAEVTKYKLSKKSSHAVTPQVLPKIKLFIKSRPKRETQEPDATTPPFKLPSFMTDLIQCNSMIQRICPGAGIGCTVCQYYSKGTTCAGVCNVKDVICNAALMRCLESKR